MSLPSLNSPQIRLEIRALQSQLISWRRHLHQYPELGFQEILTAQYISQQLQQMGVSHQTEIAKTGIVATVESSYSGSVVGIRADIDALPIQEANDIPYRSQHDGKMHACGHDGHTAIALGVAQYLRKYPDKFKGTVKIIFQPAEESPGGAKPMIEAGILQNPKVDAIFGLHLWNYLPKGTIGVRKGALMAAVECFELKIQGKGGHGAIPQHTVDSVVVGAQIVNALQSIVSRNINPLESAVVTIGEFKAGTALNVIADTAILRGTVRYFNPQFTGFFEQRMEQMIAGICQGYGATYDFNYWQLYPALINNEKMAELVHAVALEVIETPLGIAPECQTMGGEDMSFFLQEVPGCYFFLGSSNPEKQLNYPHHHPCFNFDEDVLPMGVEMFIRCLEKYYES